jgi:hypothetical protein
MEEMVVTGSDTALGGEAAAWTTRVSIFSANPHDLWVRLVQEELAYQNPRLAQAQQG